MVQKLFNCIALCVFFFIGLFGISSCVSDKSSEIVADCDTTSAYSTVVEPILKANCQKSCHVPGGTGTGDFTNYDELKQRVDNGTFKDLFLVQKTMPKDTVISTQDYNILKLWFESGAKGCKEK